MYLNITQKGGCDEELEDDCFFKHMALFEKGKANMGAKKTINISNHFGPMDFVLYTDNGVILQGKAKFINQVDKKAEKAAEKKLSMVFKYDKSGILSVQRVEAILLEDTPDEDKQIENTYQLDVKTRLSGPQPMSKD